MRGAGMDSFLQGGSNVLYRNLFRRFVYTLSILASLLCSHYLLAQTDAGQRPPRTEKSKLNTGPEVGQKIPSFRAPDQNGKMQDFNSIRGPNGAMVVFFRSADW